MCIHGQMVIHQNGLLGLIEQATIPFGLGRQIINTEKALIVVNDAFELLINDMYPEVGKRAKVHMDTLKANPLVT